MTHLAKTDTGGEGRHPTAVNEITHEVDSEEEWEWNGDINVDILLRRI